MQLRSADTHPFGALSGYVPLRSGEIALYRAIREAVPIVDAALMKIIRLVGGFSVCCGDAAAERGLAGFLRTVNVGRGQRGINSFLDQYLDSLSTCGRAVGEIVPQRGGGAAAVLCGDVSRVEVREGASPLEFCLCAWDESGALCAPAPPGTAAFYPVSSGSREPLWGVAAALHAVYDGNPAENLPCAGTKLGAGGQCALCGDLQAGQRQRAQPGPGAQRPDRPGVGPGPWRAQRTAMCAILWRREM